MDPQPPPEFACPIHRLSHGSGLHIFHLAQIFLSPSLSLSLPLCLSVSMDQYSTPMRKEAQRGVYFFGS